MSVIITRLGATNVVADTNTLLFTVPVSHEYTVISLVVCNTGSTQRTFRLAHIDSDVIGNVELEDYLAYDKVLAASDVYVYPVKLCVPAGHSFMVRASHAEVVFSATGIDKTL